MAYMSQKKIYEDETDQQEGKKTLFVILVASNVSNGDEMEIQWERYYVTL